MANSYQYDIQAPDGSVYTIEAPGEAPKSFGEKIGSALSDTGDILSNAAMRTVAAGPASFNSITGGFATQFGHDVKLEALKKTSIPQYPFGTFGYGSGDIHEAIASGTDPQSIVTGLVADKKYNAELRRPGVLNRLNSFKEGVKSRGAVSKLLPQASIASDIEQGKPIAVQVEGQNVIKKTSNPMDLVNKFRNERDNVISQVDELVAQNNKPIDPKVIVPRVKLILQKVLDNSSPEEKIKLKKALATESDWLLNQKDFDAVKANARKRYLYEETQGTQKKQAAGKTIVVQPEVQLAKDAVAQALKEHIEGVHPDISKLNARFSGLDQGVKAASKLVEASMEQGSMGERIAAQVAGRPSPQSAAAAAVRELPFMRKSISKLSGDVEKHANRSSDFLTKSRQQQGARLLDRFISNREYAGSLLTSPDTIKMLDDLTSKASGAITDKSPRPNLGLPKGQGFEMVSPEESAGRIRLEQFKKDFKMPDFSNVRKRIKYGK